MKRIIFLAFILCLSLSFIACGGEQTPTETEQPVATPAPEAEPVDTATDSEPAQTSFEVHWPTEEYELISRGWIPSFHHAIDIVAQEESDIYAAEQGVVTTSEWSQEGYGNYIIIDHGDGIETLYAHNLENVVEAGDEVEKGQLIGYMGTTGNSTRVHLHFEIRIDGEKVPTEPYLGLEMPQAEEVEIVSDDN